MEYVIQWYKGLSENVFSFVSERRIFRSRYFKFISNRKKNEKQDETEDDDNEIENQFITAFLT